MYETFPGGDSASSNVPMSIRSSWRRRQSGRGDCCPIDRLFDPMACVPLADGSMASPGIDCTLSSTTTANFWRQSLDSANLATNSSVASSRLFCSSRRRICVTTLATGRSPEVAIDTVSVSAKTNTPNAEVSPGRCRLLTVASL